jgi:hypothetical protein
MKRIVQLVLFFGLHVAAWAQALYPPQFTQGDAVVLPYSAYSIPTGTYPYNFVSIGIVPTVSSGAPITDSNSGFGARAAAVAAIVECYSTDSVTVPAAATPGTCSAGTTYTGPFTTTGTVTLMALSTEAGHANSSVTTTTITIETFWPPAGPYAYGVEPVITGIQGGNNIYTTNGTTPTANGSCAATNGTAIANATAIPALSTGMTTVESITCIGGISGSVQTADYTVRSPETWFVLASGGTRYDATNVPSGQCNGLANAAYPGTGVNQNCAFNDVRYLWDLDARLGGLGTWVIAGGDTVVIGGCTALATQSNPSNPDCRIGWDQNNGGAGNSWCYAVGNQDCTNPPIPIGTASQHTVIEGICELTSSCNPVDTYPYTSNLPQIFAGFGLQYSFNLTDTAYVDIRGIELTTHNYAAAYTPTQCSHGGAPGYPGPCNTSTPDDFADNGFTTNNFSSNITFTDVYCHGFEASCVFGPIGTGIVMTRMIQNFSAFAAHNFNDDSDTPNWPMATIAEHYLIQEGNGCTELYPINPTYAGFPASGCWDTNSSGFGDGDSGQDTNLLSYTADHRTVQLNTKDGSIGPHAAIGTLSETDSLEYANMGQQWKWGVQPSGTALFENDIINGDCTRMATQVPGARINFNQSTSLAGAYLTGYCRAGGNNVDYLAQVGSSSQWINNTMIMNGEDGIDFDCGPAGGGFTNCGSVVNAFVNNIFLGYTNPAFGVPSTLFTSTSGSNSNATITYAVEYGLSGMGTCGSNGIICASPALVSQPATPWPGADADFDNFNYNLTSGSPAITAGTTPCATTDFFGNTQTVPCTDGAVVYTSGPPTVATPTFSPPAGTYGSTQSVVISTVTGGASIVYTNDGSTPTVASLTCTITHGTLYTGAVSVATSQTLNAIGCLSGDNASSVGSAAYVISSTVATPTAAPPAGMYVGTQSVVLSNATGGASICFTTDGSTPTAPTAGTCSGGTTQTYTTAISVAVTTTIKAIGTLSGSMNSSMATFAYIINPIVNQINTFGNVGVLGNVKTQ